MCKRIATTSLILTIMCISFLMGYTQVLSVPVYANGDSPDGVPVGYSPAGLNDQVDAFRSYCKSRNLFVEGSALDTITDVTTSVYQHLVADVGFDINELQNQIYKNTKDNIGAKWFFTQTGISAYNRLFAELLQNNDLAVGDTVDNKEIFSGEVFTDDDGNSCIVFVINKNQPTGSIQDMNLLVKRGTFLKYSGSYLNSYMGSDTYFNASFNIFGRTYSGNITGVKKSSNGLGWSKYNSSSYNGLVVSWYDDYNVLFANGVDGGCAVYKLNNGVYYIGSVAIGKLYPPGSGTKDYFKFNGIEINRSAGSGSNSSITTQNVYYTTNNMTINNNTYEGDTYITNEGDIINNPAPTQPNNPNDTITNIPQNPISQNPDSGDWNIDLPDLDIPNLPLGNLSEKFPFSIPWDLVAFYAMMDAEPQAPRFNGTLDLWVVDWDFDIDLSPFDSASELCRKLQFGLFVVGLIVATRDLIRG